MVDCVCTGVIVSASACQEQKDTTSHNFESKRMNTTLHYTYVDVIQRSISYLRNSSTVDCST
jgi:hypothetical protein